MERIVRLDEHAEPLGAALTLEPTRPLHTLRSSRAHGTCRAYGSSHALDALGSDLAVLPGRACRSGCAGLAGCACRTLGSCRALRSGDGGRGAGLPALALQPSRTLRSYRALLAL